jgi:16S rRNA G966 N2-methylase RsmD
MCQETLNVYKYAYIQIFGYKNNLYKQSAIIQNKDHKISKHNYFIVCKVSYLKEIAIVFSHKAIFRRKVLGCTTSI